jgi:hypothetical protein
MKQFERYLKVVRERGGDGPHIGRPWCLPLADRVLLVAVHYWPNPTGSPSPESAGGSETERDQLRGRTRRQNGAARPASRSRSSALLGDRGPVGPHPTVQRPTRSGVIPLAMATTLLST